MAKTSLGATLSMGVSASPLTALAELTNITPTKITRDTIDVSHLGSTGGKDYLAAGLYDLAEVTVSMNYEAGSATDDALSLAATEGTLRYFEIVAKAGTGTEDITFSGFVTSYGPDEFTVDGKQQASATIKPTGDIAQAAS